MIPQILDQKYTEIEPYLKALRNHVKDTIAVFSEENNFPFTGRIKTIESLAEKIEMGRYEKFSDIDDLVAFTIVIPSSTHESKSINFCKNKFNVEKIKTKKETEKSPETFRFDSTRIIARAVPPADYEDINTPSIYKYKIEIQIRTAFEHAWSVATHDLVYKSDVLSWNRIRLGAQLKASTEGLDAAVSAFDELSKVLDQSPWRHLNGSTKISEFVSNLFSQGLLPTTLRPHSVSRFGESFFSLCRAIRPVSSIEIIIDTIGFYIINAGEDKIPKSLSLYQLFIVILFETKLISGIEKIPCHITRECQIYIPHITEAVTVFDYLS